MLLHLQPGPSSCLAAGALHRDTGVHSSLRHLQATRPRHPWVAAGTRDVLPPQGPLTCSEPPSVPTAFGPHPCRPSPSTSIFPFVFEAACSTTRTSSPPSDSCTTHAERGGAARLCCRWGGRGSGGWRGRGTCSQQHVPRGDGLWPRGPLCLAEVWACATWSQHAGTRQANWAVPLCPVPQSWLHGSTGEGACWVPRRHSPKCRCATGVSLGKGAPDNKGTAGLHQQASSR